MTPAELDRFLHQLIEAMTAIRGWTDLATRGLPHDAPERHYLEQAQHTVMLTAQRIQEQQRRVEADETFSEAYASIQEDQIICLECGQALVLLSHRHLAGHDLTPERYRRKHHIALNQILCARSLERRRHRLAQQRRRS